MRFIALTFLAALLAAPTTSFAADKGSNGFYIDFKGGNMVLVDAGSRDLGLCPREQRMVIHNIRCRHAVKAEESCRSIRFSYGCLSIPSKKVSRAPRG